jgi:hypothetical protein
MPNMSYCMFQNTYRDLMDCYESLEEGGKKFSEEEMEAYCDMLEVCRDIIAWSEENEPNTEYFGDDEE